MVYSIIIPTAFNHLEDNLKPCIESIQRNTDLTDTEIIIVANGCVNETLDYITSLGSPFKLLRFSEALGYPKAVNEGLKVATGDYIILLNDDIILLDNNWVSLLLEPFNSDSSTGITGPVKFSRFYGAIERTAIAFWCCMFTRNVLKDLGYLNEIFSPGMGEDTDFCVRASLIGYKLVRVPTGIDNIFGEKVERQDFPIYHKGSGTFSTSDYTNIIERNTKYLADIFSNHLERVYDICVHQESDIGSESFTLLRKYATRCKHVTEFGVRGVFSTYALLAAKPKRMVSYDIYTSSNIIEAKEAAKENNIDFEFIEQDVLTVTIEPTDLLFIDTRHTYTQLIQELCLHGNKVKKYIIMHDTDVFGYIDANDESEKNPIKFGLQPAIKEFIENNPQWHVDFETKKFFGLTVLARDLEGENTQYQVSTEISNINNTQSGPGPTGTAGEKGIRYSIVVPTYNHLSNCLKPCLESIIKYTDLGETEIIVVANGCTDGTQDYVKSLGNSFKLLDYPEAMGYTKATNAGINITKGQFVVLLNNDSILLNQEKNTWLKMLSEPLINSPTVGLTGPLTLYDNYSGDYTLIFFCVMIRKSLLEELAIYEALDKRINKTQFDLITEEEKKNYKKSYLDESYSPGGGEDIDFCERAKTAGYWHVNVPDSDLIFTETNCGQFPIYHAGEGTFNEIPEYGARIIRENGLKNMIRYNKHIKLNLGCGGYELPDSMSDAIIGGSRIIKYMGVDKYDSRASIIMDVENLKFPENSVEEMIASHVFEHLNPYKIKDILKNWFYVLKPGGKLIMEMPNIEEICKLFITASKDERYGLLNCIYGSVNTTENSGNLLDITSPHLFGWYPEILYDHLGTAGFVNIIFEDQKFIHPGPCFHVECDKPV
jgi:GT2 family glycosyltransferase